MTEQTVEAVIDAAVQESQQPVADVKPEQETEPNSEQPNKEAPKSEEDVPFPKKAVNAISRRDRQIGKYRAELEYWKAQAQQGAKQTQSPNQNSQSPAEPKEDDYQNYGDYLKAVAKYEAKNEIEQGLSKQRETMQKEQVSAQEAAWIDQRAQVAHTKVAEYTQKHPEMIQVFQENADIIQAIPPHIEMAFLEADNAPLAAYALAKEGKLEELFGMSPARAAMEIARAEARGESMLKTPISKAPNPIQSNRGSGAINKNPSNMSVDEALKWMTS